MSGGEHPSWFQIGEFGLSEKSRIGTSHPVEAVSWEMCDELRRRHGLVLPTAAQWEYGCRAGTSTIWFTPDTPESLEGYANVRDRSAADEFPGGVDFDDGFKFLAPVGAFEPNAFGLHDTHGNVFEWCRDWLGPNGVAPRPGDGLRDPGPASGQRLRPGGSFRGPPSSARSGLRPYNPPDFRSNTSASGLPGPSSRSPRACGRLSRRDAAELTGENGLLALRRFLRRLDHRLKDALDLVLVADGAVVVDVEQGWPVAVPADH